jgi:NADH-quinone oxidoreductase subunit H
MTIAAPRGPQWNPVQLIEQLGVAPFYAEYVVWPAIQLALVFFVILTAVAYLVYLERKVSAFMQARLGPMRVGPIGLLQPLADGIKLLAKEDLVPEKADRFVFLIAPVIGVATALGVLALVPFGAGWATVTDVNIGLLFILSVSSIGVFGIVLAGWSSNSKYALLGAIRSSAQLVSYEVAIGLALIGPLLFARSLSMEAIVEAQRFTGIWFVLFQPIAFGVYFVAALAETK